MTRKAPAAHAAGAVLSSRLIHLPYHASENPTPQTRFVCSLQTHAAWAASFRRGGPPIT